ncbi:ribonuclease H-like domain-containing protein [Tanacetum coccineum]
MTVGYPNGTEAYIFKIENLRLSNGLTLYDVMVIPEYCVTLISVHKLVKENKWEGLYYYNDQGHLADPVLNVLKDSLPIDKKDNIVCCEIFQRAKQTREHFPLSDHTSKRLGDLVHLDLWAPYKVTSSEGFRYFLTVVDDYTRAVWVYLIESKDEYNDLNKNKSDSSSSSVSGSNINTADFLVDNSRNYADISDEFVSTQNEKIATLEENIFSKGNLDQNPSSSHGVQNVRRCLLNVAMCMSWHVFQIDVNNAFLYGDLEEVVYMKPPEGYFPSINKIEKFKKFLKSKFMIKDFGKLKYFLGIEVVDTNKD